MLQARSEKYGLEYVGDIACLFLMLNGFGYVGLFFGTCFSLYIAQASLQVIT